MACVNTKQGAKQRTKQGAKQRNAVVAPCLSLPRRGGVRMHSWRNLQLL